MLYWNPLWGCNLAGGVVCVPWRESCSVLMLYVRQFVCGICVCVCVCIERERERGFTGASLLASMCCCHTEYGEGGRHSSGGFSCLSLTFSVQDFLQDVATKTVPDPLHLAYLPPSSVRRHKREKERKKNWASAFNFQESSSILE